MRVNIHSGLSVRHLESNQMVETRLNIEEMEYYQQNILQSLLWA